MKTSNKNFFLLVLVSIFIVATSSPCYSQLDFYPKIGANYSCFGKVDYPPAPVESKWILNFNAGGGARIKLSKQFSLQAELLWNVKGGESILINIQEPTQRITYRLGYISLPVNLAFSHKKFSAYIGVEQSLFIQGSFQFFDGDRNRFTNIVGRKPAKKYDTGLICGINYFVNKRFFIDLRYFYGLMITHTYTPHNINGVVFVDGVEYNRVISASVGYLLSK